MADACNMDRSSVLILGILASAAAGPEAPADCTDEVIIKSSNNWIRCSSGCQPTPSCCRVLNTCNRQRRNSSHVATII
jgi:hypothetical protein